MFIFRKVLFALLQLCSLDLYSQQISYQTESLLTVFQNLEKETGTSFNYDPDLISLYTFEGTINLNDEHLDISAILKNTPLSYRAIDNKNILITFSPKRKYKFCGWVKDLAYGTPLQAANIYANDIISGTQTDESGYFELYVEAYKNQRIDISYIGYKTKSFLVGELAEDNCLTVNLKVDKEIFGSEIVIKDYIHKGITEGKSFNSTSIDIKQTITETGHDEHDILRTVQTLPGITSLDESAGNLNIRGSTPDQNMLVWERATLYDSGHLFGMISTVNPFVLDQVNVYKGVFDPSYDNRIGGLVEMSLPNKMPAQFSGGFGTTLSEAHAHLKVPLIKDKLGIIVSGRNSIHSIINSPTINRYTEKVFQLTTLDRELSADEEGYRDQEEDINFSDINFKLFYQATNKLIFKSSLLKSGNAFNAYTLTGDIETEDDLVEKTWAFSNELSYQWNNSLVSTLYIVDSDYQFNYTSEVYDVGGSIFFDDEEEEEDEYEFLRLDRVQNNINDLSIGLSNDLMINQKSTLDIDLSVDVKDVKWLYEEQSTYTEDYIDEEFDEGLFSNLSAAYDFHSDRLQFMLGSKLTYYHDTKSVFSSPRMSLQYLLKKDLKIKLSAGKMYQFISQLSLNEDNDLGGLRNFWVMANSNSDEVMNSNKFSVGLVSAHKGWLIDIDAYLNKNYGLSSLSANLNAGVDLIESGESTSKGIETLVKKSWDKYSVWFSYTLSDNQYFFPDTDMDPFPANNDHRHNLSVVNTYTYKDYTFSLSYNYRSGLPYSKPHGLVATEYEDYIDYSLGFNELNNLRLDSYHRVDASITYKKQFYKEKLNAELNLSMVNVFNARNVYSRDSYLISDSEIIDAPVIQSFDKYLLRRTPKLLFRVYW